MIFVDTSVWIQYFRGGDDKLIANLHEILESDHCALSIFVWLELLTGARKSELSLLKRTLSALPRYNPSETTWNLVETWIKKGTESGHKFGAVDLLIAAVAQEKNSQLWSLDSDFKRMEKLGFVSLFRPK